MTNDLLNAPERGAIEAFLAKLDTAEGAPPSYERLLGFLSGVVITPGLFMPSQWLQPLLDKNGIVFDTMDAANAFIGAMMPLYNRVNDLRLLEVNLCPFEFNNSADLEAAKGPATDWSIGLHEALKLRAEVWVPEDDDRHIPKQSHDEMLAAIPFLWAVADPQAIPEIVPDPIPFQRKFLTGTPGHDGVLSENWDDELMELFGIFCLGQLKSTMAILQRYSKACGDRAPVAAKSAPLVREGAKIGRNDPCPCGSGKKFKKCCGA